MTGKRALALSVVALVAVPPYAVAAPLATLSGAVTSATGSPLVRVDLEVVNLDNGRVSAVRTDGIGVFKTRLEPGLYSVGPRGGYTVVRGPRVVRLVAGQSVSADLSLASMATQDSGTTDATSSATTGGTSLGNVLAVSIFSAALLGVVIRSATLGPPDFNPETPLK